MNRILRLLVPVSLAATVATLFTGCTSPVPNRDPLGERFPSIVATPLDGGESEPERADGETVRIPEDFGGDPVLLLIGYVQDTQFDIDRWLFGVLDAELDIALREVPAARGMGARIASGFINSGMRRGIPKAEWGAVVTTYGKAADTIGDFTGTVNPRNARVLLLDRDGVVRWFHDAGFSSATLIDLRRAVESY